MKEQNEKTYSYIIVRKHIMEEQKEKRKKVKLFVSLSKFQVNESDFLWNVARRK